jgi:hypothetical protein
MGVLKLSTSQQPVVCERLNSQWLVWVGRIEIYSFIQRTCYLLSVNRALCQGGDSKFNKKYGLSSRSSCPRKGQRCSWENLIRAVKDISLRRQKHLERRLSPDKGNEEALYLS